MRDLLVNELGAEVELIAGSGGIFVISADGREVFSKAKSGRFPEPAEIVDVLKNV